MAQKAARIAEISGRKQVSGFTMDGRQRYGIPVTRDEWQCLPDGKSCITMKDGQAYEAFKVSRNGGSHARQSERAFISSSVVTKGVSVGQTINAIGEKNLTIKGDTVSVLVFASMDDVKQLRAAGLNSGTLVAVSSDGGKFGEVYAVYKDNIKTIGQFKPAKV